MILVLNAGSSSIKFSLFDNGLAERLSGIAEEIGGAARLTIDGKQQDIALPDHAAALSAIFASPSRACVRSRTGLCMAARISAHPAGSPLLRCARSRRRPR